MPRRIRQIMLSDEVATLPPSASVYAAAAVMKRRSRALTAWASVRFIMWRAPGTISARPWGASAAMACDIAGLEFGRLQPLTV